MGPPKPIRQNADTVVNPTLVVEVLSPGTVGYDLGEKFEHYRRIPSLTAVLYVSQDRRQIEIRSKQDGDWKTAAVGPGGATTVPALGVSIDVDALYADAGA